MTDLHKPKCLLVALAGLLFWSFGAQAEHYTVPLLVPAGTTSEPQGVLRILNATDESGTVEIYAIDDTGTRSGPATFTLSASAAAEFTATDLASGNATLGLTGGIGTEVGDARLQIETDLDIVPLAFVRAADGTLSAMHDTVRAAETDGSSGYTYNVPVFNPSTEMTQTSRLRLINPGDAAAAVTISGRNDSGAEATGGDVTLTLAAGGAKTLTAQQLEAGDTAITGQLGAGTGKWRLTVLSDQPLEVVNIGAASAAYWNNLSTTAVPEAAPADLEAFNERFVGSSVVYDSGNGPVGFEAADGERFTETTESDGFTEVYGGGYSYGAIGPDAGRLTFDYDDGHTCRANLYFESRTSGWFASHCTGDDFPAGGGWRGGRWFVEADSVDGSGEVDLFPGFRAADGPGNQSYSPGIAIDTLTLPTASGGNGTLSYSLTPAVPGLTFNATTRRLAGTPSTAGTYAMTYTVRDIDGDTDTLSFTISVSADTSTEGTLDACQVGMTLRSGESCTYQGTTDVFSVNVRGRASFLGRLAGIRIRIDNETINGRVYDFEASHQGDGVWRIDRIAGSTEPPTDDGTDEGTGTDASPSFEAGAGPGNQMYTVGTAISALTLPEASGGDGTLTYSLSPDVPGLTFDGTLRQLTGVPSTTGTYAMTYTATDGDGDTATLRFNIAVEESDSDDGSTSAPVSIPDANLRAAIEAALGKASGAAITAAEVTALTRLSARDARIGDLTGIEYATNLTSLDLDYNDISTVSSLAGLTELTELSLRFNRITDVSPLEALTKLTHLALGANKIADVSPLRGMIHLTSLNLDANRITDVSDLAGLASLGNLRLQQNAITDASPLGRLASLELALLDYNAIMDVSSLANLSNLHTLGLKGNPLSVTSINDHLPALRRNGVAVGFDRFPKGDYDIELVFLGDFHEGQKNVVRYVARRWMSVIVEDLPDHQFSQGWSSTCGGQSLAILPGEQIDDLRIYVGVFEDAEGPAGLGGTNLLRQNHLPIVGCMTLKSPTYWEITALHEVGHVLGFGRKIWSSHELLQDFSSVDPNADTHFNGPLAIEAFNEAGGLEYAGAKVPVQKMDGSHWRYTVLPGEVMGPRGGESLSAITVQSLADLGYGVDVTQADRYAVPGTAATGASTNEMSLPVISGNDLSRAGLASPAQGLTVAD